MSGPRRRGRLAMEVVAVLVLAATALPIRANASSIVVGATGVSTNMGTGLGSLTDLIDHSGLTNPYTSGVTDFTTYVSTTGHRSNITGNIWASATGTPFGVVTFDLGVPSLVDGLALWNLQSGGPATLRSFNLFADSDSDFSNGTIASLGSFSPPAEGASPVPARVFDFDAVTTRFLQMQITGNNGGTLTGFGEIVFREPAQSAVPEPGSLILIVTGLAGISARLHRRRRFQD